MARLRAGLLATIAAVSLHAPALAAEAAPEQPQLEDIVVTADRTDSFGAELVQVGTFRDARIIDVPLTVNVVPREVIDAQAGTSIYDALRNTAGVTRSQLNGATYDNIAIRGILVENRTSYRLNGSLPIVNLVDLPLENKERVEVLKGVGALYYGFAPPSGIINLTSKRPTGRVATFTASGTNHGAYTVHADVGGRLGSDEQFGLRFNGVAGHVESGIDRFDGERYLASLAADWDVSDSLSLKLDIEHVSKDVTEPAAIQLLPAANGRIALPAVPDIDTNLADAWLRYNAHATNVLARADWRITDSWALRLEGGQALTVRDRDFSQFERYDLTTGEGGLRIFQTRDQRFRNRNLRAELAGAFATGPLTHEIIVGATSNWRYQNGRANQTTATRPDGSYIVTQNLFQPRSLGFIPAVQQGISPTDIEDRGVYLFERAKWGEAVQILAGVRYSDYESETRNNAGVRTAGYEASKWTPSFGLVLKPFGEDISVYGTYLEGLEEGGSAPANALNQGDVLPPAVSKQYELGLKGEALTGVIFQLAGFQVERAFATLRQIPNSAPLFELGGEAHYRGVEASLTGEVTRALSIYASGQYLDAELVRTVQAAERGMRPENTPKWTGSLFAEYRPAAIEGLALGGGAFYVGARPVNNVNQAFVDGYTTFSLSARYTIKSIANGLTLQLNADNITNKRYWNSAGNGLLGVGLPRQVKLTARVAL